MTADQKAALDVAREVWPGLEWGWQPGDRKLKTPPTLRSRAGPVTVMLDLTPYRGWLAYVTVRPCTGWAGEPGCTPLGGADLGSLRSGLDQLRHEVQAWAARVGDACRAGEVDG